MEGGRSLCAEAVKVFAEIFREYLNKNGRRTYSIAKLTGQKAVSISVRAFFRLHKPSESFPTFSNLLETLTSGNPSRFRRVGIDVKVEGGELHLILKLDLMEELMGLDLGGLMDFFTPLCGE